MLHVFEAAVREVAFWSVLSLGCLCLIAGVVAFTAWTLKRLIGLFGLTRDFHAFVRQRRRGR